MTTPRLPPDPSDWPDDAYEVLGVSSDSSRDDLRRAYSRLVRIYKPEHAPEAFRRLRKAYEQALAWADFHVQFRSEEPSEESAEEGQRYEPLPPVASADATAPDLLEQEAACPSPARQRLVEDELQNAWSQWSIDPLLAYRRLLTLRDRNPQDQDVYLRLFWLLKLRPQVDQQATPGQWATRGMLACGTLGPLRELYRRESAERPAEALSGDSTKLIHAQQHAGPLLDLVAVRWRAAARLQQFDSIRQDLENLRPRWEREDPDAWLRLLLAAVDELAWWPEEGPVSLFDLYAQEINRLGTIKIAHFDALARLDLLSDLSTAFQRLSNSAFVPRELTELVARSWTISPWELEVEATRTLVALARQPHQLMDNFDRLQELSPGLLAQIGSLLQHAELMRRTSNAGWPTEVLTQLVLDFVASSTWQQHHLFRSTLIQFCVDELIAPDQVAQTLQNCESYWINPDKHLSHAILNDWPLRYVYQAHRLLVA